MTTTHDSPMQTRFHPGEHLGLELNELELPPEELASKLGVPTHLLIDFIAQKAPVTADLAMRLGHFFGTSPQMWMNMQNGYELEQATWRSGYEIDRLPTLERKAA